MNGVSWSDPSDIGRVFTQYYQSLFTTANPKGFVEVLSGVHSLVTPEMNAGLTRRFTHKELNEALSQMHPLKSPWTGMFLGFVFTSSIGIQLVKGSEMQPWIS
jgi:hypothetical protein